MSASQERNLAIISHAASLIGVLLSVFFIYGQQHVAVLVVGLVLMFVPHIVLLQVFGSKSDFVDSHFKNTINFAVTYIICVALSLLALQLVLGIFFLPLTFAYGLVVTIMGILKASKGNFYKYTMTKSILKPRVTA